QHDFELQPGQCAIYLIIPSAGAVTPIGLTDKYISIDAVCHAKSEGYTSAIQLKEGGAFRFVSGNRHVAAQLNGKQLPISLISEHLYEIDVPMLDEKLNLVLSVSE
ncbi:hypothetical protein AB4Z22_05420, partial [Paenibacillus sp. TAF58]